jgi:hypothetical protein
MKSVRCCLLTASLSQLVPPLDSGLYHCCLERSDMNYDRGSGLVLVVTSVPPFGPSQPSVQYAA